MPLRTKQSSSSFFDDLSYATRYSGIEFLLAIAARSEAEIGWTEGIVHEMKSTQKGTEILLVHPPSLLQPSSSSGSKHNSVPDANETDDVLGVFINCTEFSRFVFTIGQHIKISLKGARIIRELGPFESGILPFSLVFSGDIAIQYLSGGVCVPDGAVIDTRQGRDYHGACSCLEFLTSRPLPDNPGVTPPRTPPRKSSPRYTWPPFLGRTSTPSPNKIRRDYNDIKTYPPLNPLTEGMETPLLGMVETIKTPSTTISGGLCVHLILADVSSYRAKRGFRVTCFTRRSSFARDLPTPSPGDVILFKSVNIGNWAGGVSGTVCENKLDWIVYDRDRDRVIPAEHAVSAIMNGRDAEGFYTDVLARKGLFKQFIAAMWRCSMNEWGLRRDYSLPSRNVFPLGQMFFQ